MTIIHFLAMLSLLSGCSMFKSYTPDNPAEEAVEAVIKAKTGVDLDLTPGSPE